MELADSERKCPLCKTPVYFPGLSEEPEERQYPKFVSGGEKISPRGLYFIISFIFAIAAIISVICDISLNSRFDWGGYVLGALALAYVVFILPVWFRRPSPAVFVPADFAAVALYVLYIDLLNSGGWFLSFALPIIAALALVVCAVVILIYYLKCGRLYIYGGASIALGLVCVMIELLLHANFSFHHSYLMWSVYPLVSFFMIGIMLIIIAIVKPFRESLKKIFAI